jgi:hypothetical protein
MSSPSTQASSVTGQDVSRSWNCTVVLGADGKLSISLPLEVDSDESDTQMAASVAKINTAIRLVDAIEADMMARACDTSCVHAMRSAHYEETIELLKSIAMPSAQHKGILGEMFVEKTINAHIASHDSAYVMNRTKDQSHCSDLDVRYKNIRCCVEVKNIDKQLSYSNVQVFQKTYMSGEDYNCGLFVSLRSTFGPSTGVKDFGILYEGTKPCIYLENAMETPWKITAALDVLNFLVSNDSMNGKSEIAIKLLESSARNNALLLKTAMTRLNAITKDVNEVKKIVKQSMTSLLEDSMPSQKSPAE